jgi:hypothetical protein
VVGLSQPDNQKGDRVENDWVGGRLTVVGPEQERAVLSPDEWEMFWSIVNFCSDDRPAFTWDASDLLESN